MYFLDLLRNGLSFSPTYQVAFLLLLCVSGLRCTEDTDEEFVACLPDFVPGEAIDEADRIHGTYGDVISDDAFDGRTTWPQCKELFFDKIGLSSGACGDCYGQAAASFLGISLCTTHERIEPIRPIPPGTLSTMHAITSLKGKVNGCSGGHLHDIEQILRQGLKTGDNVAGEAGQQCINYDLKKCSNPNWDFFGCPNSFWRTWRRFNKPYKRPPRDCDDPNMDSDIYGKKTYVSTMTGSPVSEEDIKLQLTNTGAVIVAYRAGQKLLQFGRSDETRGKVFSEIEMPEKEANHYFLIIGWGLETKGEHEEKYWIVKNSWGTGFGEDGYIKIRRGVNLNLIESQVTYFQSVGDQCQDMRKGKVYKHLMIRRKRTLCSADGWIDCPIGCRPHGYRYTILDFFCQDENDTIATTRKVKVTVRCSPNLP